MKSNEKQQKATNSIKKVTTDIGAGKIKTGKKKPRRAKKGTKSANGNQALASHVSFLFVFAVSKQKYFQLCVRLNFTTTKLEKSVVDGDRDFSASGC